jgi:hypothetical protein
MGGLKLLEPAAHHLGMGVDAVFATSRLDAVPLLNAWDLQ